MEATPVEPVITQPLAMTTGVIQLLQIHMVNEVYVNGFTYHIS